MVLGLGWRLKMVEVFLMLVEEKGEKNCLSQMKQGLKDSFIKL
tara:strand:+ start:1379 stop:1507 length:129 start_codon:yes stop_codon:yes gene_type:complete